MKIYIYVNPAQEAAFERMLGANFPVGSSWDNPNVG
jgi:hypothetical protein